MALPKCFCWTRFGAEAGQSIEQIFARKEQERIANAGVFFWGIGNAIGPSMLALLQRTGSPEVLFSPIRSAPRREDAMPSRVVAWTQAQTLCSEDYPLPEQSLITSRLDPQRPRSKHYALVCYSESPLAIGISEEQIHFGKVRNLLTSRIVGASQVTSVVCLSVGASPTKNLTYDVALRSRLAPPYFIELRAPIPLADSSGDSCWAEIVRKTWDEKRELRLVS
jgi:hypothetical protein